MMELPSTPTATVENAAAKSAVATKKAANSYYYWHGHEKERAAVGDVAPMPVPVLVHSEAKAAGAGEDGAPVLQTVHITSYSWCDDEANSNSTATIYIDLKRSPESGCAGAIEFEAIEEGSLQVSFFPRLVKVRYLPVEDTATTVGKPTRRVERLLLLPLANPIVASKCTFRVKPKSIVIKLSKVADAATGSESSVPRFPRWIDLLAKNPKPIAVLEAEMGESVNANETDSDVDDE